MEGKMTVFAQSVIFRFLNPCRKEPARARDALHMAVLDRSLGKKAYTDFRESLLPSFHRGPSPGRQLLARQAIVSPG